MNGLDQKQEFILQVGQCVEALRKLEYSSDHKDQKLQMALTERFLGLSKLAAAYKLGGMRQLAECVAERLSAEKQMSVPLQQLEYAGLKLAAEWLDELMQLYTNDLPEPRGPVNNLVYSFTLLDRAEMAGRLQLSESPDPFAGDPVETTEVWMSYLQGKDPFSEDPGFGHLFDLLQRTLNHVSCLGVTCGPDPFARDPQVCQTGIVDIFEQDPPLSTA